MRSVLLIILVGVVFYYYGNPARSQVFDLYQMVYPRVRRTDPVIIVAIDERSLRRRGQWPWPRTWLAQLVERVAAARPAAIGLALLISEADRLSPDRLPELIEGLDRGLAQKLGSMPTNDALLARALRDRRVVVGMAGVESGETAPPDGRGPAPVRVFGGDPTPFVRQFPTALRIVKEIDAAAAGRGLVNVDLERGVVRRIPVLALVGDALTPTLGLEMLRVAANVPAIAVRVGGGGVRTVGAADRVVRTEPDGRVWLHFSRSDPRRFVSAADVLEGAVAPERFEGRLVLIGVTALGLAEELATPVGEPMSGVEIHAQLLESMLDGTLLSRPPFARWFPLGLLLIVGLAVRCVYDRVSAWRSVAVTALAVGVPVLVCVAAFVKYHVLLDPLPTSVTIIVVLGQHTLEKVSQLARLKRFFSPRLADLIVEGGAADPLRSHRREVTVVFLDLRGFTAFADTTGPEEVMGLLHEYQAEMGRVILDYEGTLERFTGDGMMIFFNDPVPMPDASERAVRMAEVMRERFRELDKGWRQRGYSLGFAIGIAQGDATLGAIGFEGRWDYAAIGTVTNLAARLCAEARSEQILISPGLAEIVRGIASLEALGPLTLKGFSRALPVFSVLGLKNSERS